MNLLHCIIIITAVIAYPKDAFSWGPIAHLDFALQIVTGAVAIAPALLSLLNEHKFDFLYGTLAADVIVGKNRAQSHDHCHTWNVARQLLKIAKSHGSHREAFILGYFHHLGTDVVAHNHIIPQMMIIHFKTKGVGHLYWEVRSDQRLLRIDPELKDIWHTLSKYKFPGHDDFLKRELVPTIFPNNISASLYKRNLHVQRAGPWRRAIARIDDNSKLLFDEEDLLKWRKLAVHAGARAIQNPWSGRLDNLDPIGAHALHTAALNRKSLRREFKKYKNSAHLNELYHHALTATRTIHIDHFEEDIE